MFRPTYDEEEKLWYGPQIKLKWTEGPSLGSKILNSFKLNCPNVTQVKLNLNLFECYKMDR